jgi:hypothetical protein
MELTKGQELVNDAKNEFEADSIIGLDRSKMTFVCDLCKCVNGIDSPRCSKCGKPRPRNEYVSAMKTIRLSQQTKQDPLLFQDALKAKIEERNKIMQAEAKRAALEKDMQTAYETELETALRQSKQREEELLKKARPRRV